MCPPPSWPHNVMFPAGYSRKDWVTAFLLFPSSNAQVSGTGGRYLTSLFSLPFSDHFLSLLLLWSSCHWTAQTSLPTACWQLLTAGRHSTLTDNFSSWHTGFLYTIYTCQPWLLHPCTPLVSTSLDLLTTRVTKHGRRQTSLCWRSHMKCWSLVILHCELCAGHVLSLLSLLSNLTPTKFKCIRYYFIPISQARKLDSLCRTH